MSGTASGKAVRYLVSGRVQGVFFRASATEEARRLGLSGWARNLPDGRVEVVAAAAGDLAEEQLSQLAAWLWQGPPAARVESVVVEEWREAVSPGFGIR